MKTTNLKQTLTVLILILTGLAAYSQHLVDIQRDSLMSSHRIIRIGQTEQTTLNTDSIKNLIEKFYYDQFRHSQNPNAPYILFMSRDSKLAMGIGGAVRMRAYYDWDGAIPVPGFAPYLIPMTPDPTNIKSFNTTPAGTCLFFRVIGQHEILGDYQLYIECNFDGYKARDFHLEKAYAVIQDFTIGYASSTFSDPAALPQIIDAQGPSNKITPTNVLIRWMPTFKDRWVAAISLETPSTQITSDSITVKSSSWLPDFASFIQYQWDKTSHIRLSGILRTLSYRNLATAQNHNKLGWAVMLSSVARPMNSLTTYLTINYGHGYSSLGGDLMIGAYDLIPSPNTPGALYAPASFGWCLGVQYNIKPNLFISTSFSQTRFLPKTNTNPNEYRYGLCGNINAFWNITPRTLFGVEFDYGMRKDFSGKSQWAKRIGAVAQFSF